MKKTFILILSCVLASLTFSACESSQDDVIYEGLDFSVEHEEEEIPQIEREYSLSEDYELNKQLLVGFWEYTKEDNPGKKIKYDGGYRFHEDGTLDLVFERAFEQVGTYVFGEDNIITNDYEADSIMTLKSLTETEMIVAFGKNELFLRKVDDSVLLPFEEWMMQYGEEHELVKAARARFRSYYIDAADEVYQGVKVS